MNLNWMMLADPASLPPADSPRPITILHADRNGERALCRILPTGIRWAAGGGHPEPGWVLEAFDLDRQAARSFALKGIQNWTFGPAPA
jgi:predicted DNA-binding transcriptional regulator YafY